MRLCGEKDEKDEECGNIKCFICFYQVIWGDIASKVWSMESDGGVWNEVWGAVNHMRNYEEWSECGIVTRLLLTSDQVLVLKHPLLLSIILIIESGLAQGSEQVAQMDFFGRQKSDLFPRTSPSFRTFSSSFAHLPHTWKSSSFLTFVTSHSFLHLLSYSCLLLSLIHVWLLSPISFHHLVICNLTHYFTFVTQSIIYNW